MLPVGVSNDERLTDVGMNEVACAYVGVILSVTLRNAIYSGMRARSQGRNGSAATPSEAAMTRN